jgi:hypothetical protein
MLLTNCSRHIGSTSLRTTQDSFFFISRLDTQQMRCQYQLKHSIETGKSRHVLVAGIRNRSTLHSLHGKELAFVPLSRPILER